MSKLFLFFFSVGFLQASAVAPEASIRLASQADKGSISFTATGTPSFIKIEGKGKGANGELSVTGKFAKGTFKFLLDTLDTGIDVRNEHMKEKYLNTKEFPESTLEITQLSLPTNYDPKSGLGEGTFTGKLSLRGVTRDISGKYKSELKKIGTEELNAKFDVNLSDFKIEIPSFAGISVGDKIEIQVNTTLFAKQ